MMFRTLALSVIALASIAAASAGEYFDLGDEVAGHPGKIWYDLARAIVPDLQPDGKGTKAIELRYVADLGDADEAPIPELPIALHGTEVETIEAEGRTLTVMAIDLGPADGWAADIEVMALFDENLALLDAVNIGQDKLNGFAGEPIRISTTDEALLTYSEHFNSNQTYGSYALVMVRDGRFETIDIISTLSDRWCGHDRWQTLDVTAADTGAGYWPITATVTDIQKPTEESEECGDQIAQPGFTETYAATYSWSASMGFYVAGDEGFATLDAINQDRY